MHLQDQNMSAGELVAFADKWQKCGEPSESQKDYDFVKVNTSFLSTINDNSWLRISVLKSEENARGHRQIMFWEGLKSTGKNHENLGIWLELKTSQQFQQGNG